MELKTVPCMNAGVQEPSDSFCIDFMQSAYEVSQEASLTHTVYALFIFFPPTKHGSSNAASGKDRFACSSANSFSRSINRAMVAANRDRDTNVWKWVCKAWSLVSPRRVLSKIEPLATGANENETVAVAGKRAAYVGLVLSARPVRRGDRRSASET